MSSKNSTTTPQTAIIQQNPLLAIPPDMVPPIDTSQPPPVPGAPSLLGAMGMPFVSPFQLNNRLLGAPVSMNMPGMMPPNVPIGVPPPNLSGGPFMPLGMPPYAQGTHGFMQPPAGMHGQPFNLTAPPPQPPNTNLPSNQEDAMEIEMEEVDKPQERPSLSDQLLASIGQFNEGQHDKVDGGSSNVEEDRKDKRDDRNRSRERDRDRERDRGRNRDRIRKGESRERDRRDRDGSRGDRDRRDRNRWSER